MCQDSQLIVPWCILLNADLTTLRSSNCFVLHKKNSTKLSISGVTDNMFSFNVPFSIIRAISENPGSVALGTWDKLKLPENAWISQYSLALFNKVLISLLTDPGHFNLGELPIWMGAPITKVMADAVKNDHNTNIKHTKNWPKLLFPLDEDLGDVKVTSWDCLF